jgi:hypothetical protein
MTSWFYWSESERNVKGEELATCLHLYDTGGERDDDRDLETKLVFLDETRSTGYSWLLMVTLTGTLVPVRLYEADPHTFKVLSAPPTSVGGGEAVKL